MLQVQQAPQLLRPFSLILVMLNNTALLNYSTSSRPVDKYQEDKKQISSSNKTNL